LIDGFEETTEIEGNQINDIEIDIKISRHLQTNNEFYLYPWCKGDLQ